MLTGCSGQPLPAITASMASALDACSEPLASDSGVFDQARVKKADWMVVSRTVYGPDGLEKPGADTAILATLKTGERETTRWQSYQYEGEIEIARGLAADRSTPDTCSISATAKSSDDVGALLRAITKKAGVGISRKGAIPRGGDFLTPRFDGAPFRYYWALPTRNVYLTEFDGHKLRLDIEAVPDRRKLNPDFDTPERRIPDGAPPK